MKINKSVNFWAYSIIFIVSIPILIYAFMVFGGRKIAVYKSKNPINIHTGCLYYEDRIMGKMRFKLDVPNDPNLPIVRTFDDFFAVYQFPIYHTLPEKIKYLKLDYGFCNKAQFVFVDFGIKKSYYIYDLKPN